MKRSGLTLLLVLAALTVFRPGAAFGQLANGLLNYWNFEGNYNDTAGLIPGSASTMADNGTPSANVTIQPGGQLGQFGQFNRGAVDVPNSEDVIAAGESLTISAWFTVTNFDVDWQCLIAHGEGSDYRVARSGGGTVLSYAGGTGDISGGPALNDGGEWHHVVAITEAGVSTRLWIDNVLVATGGAPTLTNNGAGMMQIGANPGAGGRDWNGSIDDVGMWDRPLTDDEINNIYTSGLAGTPLSGLFVVVDSDGDGLPNAWETQYGLDPNSTAGNNGAAGDPDADGLTNAQEFNPHQTIPTDDDTDNDGLKDGAEVNTHQTNPRVADSDADTLSDGQEVNTLQTDPLDTDSDDDGLTDGGEVAKGSDPVLTNNGFDFGLVAYWPMDDDFNSTVNGHTTTPNGINPIPMVAGKFDNAILLDGIDQFLMVDGDENVFDFKTALNVTWSAWFTADTIDKDWQCLIAKGDASNHWRIHRRGADQPPEMTFCGGAADVPRHNVPLSIGTGQMHHLVAISEHNVSARLYFDGVLVSTGPAPFLGDSANPMRIGANPDTNPPRFWTGKIDDVAIWCRSLSEAEILQLWNEGEGTSVGALLGTGTPTTPFQFTQINFNRTTSQWTLTWTSRPGRTYSLNYSTNLTDFSADIDDSIPSGGATTTFGPFPHPLPPTESRIYFKATEN
jgi:Concanavalin A-like lectin/glucanases superfamily/Bacterial TSP3 repeat